MIFTDAQFEVLSQFEQNFNEVLDQRVARNIGDRATAQIADIWHSITGTPKRKYSCAQCRFTLLHRVGTAYRQDKAERTKAQNAEKNPEKPNNATKSGKVSARKKKTK